MKKENFITIGRWIAVIPAAVAGLFLAGIIANLFFSVQGFFTGTSPDSFWADFNHWIMSSGISSAAAVYFGCITAPSHRRAVALMLGALIIVISTISVLYALSNGEDIAWTIFSVLAASFGAGAVIYTFFEEGEDYRFG